MRRFYELRLESRARSPGRVSVMLPDPTAFLVTNPGRESNRGHINDALVTRSSAERPSQKDAFVND